jgi:L-rhamnose isomerase
LQGSGYYEPGCQRAFIEIVERRGSMIKNSVGIWAFGPAVTRFVPPGYHNEVADEPMVEKTERVAGGLSDLLEGLEYHYPGEINEDNADEVLRILSAHEMDLPVIAAGLHPDPTYAMGAFINPDDALRRQGIDTLGRGIDLCSEIGANFIIWPGAEGYNYTFQRPYAEIWRRFVEGVAELTDHANEKGVKVFLEHKNSEPAMKILMQNIGMTLFTIQKVNALDEATPDPRIRALEGIVVALRARPDDEVSPDFGAEVYPAPQGVYALAAECIVGVYEHAQRVGRVWV